MSDEFRLLFRAASGYRQIVARTTGPPLPSRRWLRRPLFLLLTLASMISILTTGRLTLPLLIEASLAWSYVPVLQVIAAACTIRVLAGRPRSLVEAVDLYFIGFGPWLLWMLALTGAALFVPTRGPALTITGFWLPGAAVAFLWSAWINYGFFRGALALTIPRAALAVIGVRTMTWGFAVAYFHLSDQLVPRLPWLQG